MQTQQDATKFCSRCSHALDTIDDFKKCPSCGARVYFNSKATSTILLRNSRDEVLLIQRAQDPKKGWWTLPGGYSNPGETLEDTGRRELAEETGLKAGELTYIGSVYEEYHFDNEAVPIIVATFEAKVQGSENIVKSAELMDCKFFAKDQIDFSRVAFDNQQAFLREYLK